MKYQQVHPETTTAGTIYASFDCHECGRKIYQAAEDVFMEVFEAKINQRANHYFHDLCRSAREAKFKEQAKEKA